MFTFHIFNIFISKPFKKKNSLNDSNHLYCPDAREFGSTSIHLLIGKTGVRPISHFYECTIKCVLFDSWVTLAVVGKNMNCHLFYVINF